MKVLLLATGAILCFWLSYGKSTLISLTDERKFVSDWTEEIASRLLLWGNYKIASKKSWNGRPRVTESGLGAYQAGMEKSASSSFTSFRSCVVWLDTGNNSYTGFHCVLKSPELTTHSRVQLWENQQESKKQNISEIEIQMRAYQYTSAYALNRGWITQYKVKLKAWRFIDINYVRHGIHDCSRALIADIPSYS